MEPWEIDSLLSPPFEDRVLRKLDRIIDKVERDREDLSQQISRSCEQIVNLRKELGQLKTLIAFLLGIVIAALGKFYLG